MGILYKKTRTNYINKDQRHLEIRVLFQIKETHINNKRTLISQGLIKIKFGG